MNLMMCHRPVRVQVFALVLVLVLVRVFALVLLRVLVRVRVPVLVPVQSKQVTNSLKLGTLRGWVKPRGYLRGQSLTPLLQQAGARRWRLRQPQRLPEHSENLRAQKEQLSSLR